MTRRDSLSVNEARRIALEAQGFRATPRMRVRRPFDAPLAHLHVLQIDSVNVFARSHHLPVFSRHGAYAPQALDAHLWDSGEFTEYWAHEAAFVPVTDRPLFSWRMDEFRERDTRSGRLEALASRAAAIRARLRAEGPQFARELETDSRRNRSGWWDWSDTKQAVEMLFAHGEVVAAGRRGFQRRYALADQVIPEQHLGAVAKREAQLMLVERASGSGARRCDTA